MTFSNSSFNSDAATAPDSASLETPVADVTPPIGITPPQVLAQEAAVGHRGAAWRLLHWIMEDDPHAFVAIVSLDDDRLAQHLLEFIALGTWAGKPFVVPVPLRSAHTRTQLRTLFLPGAGMDTARAQRVLGAAIRDHRPAIRETATHILGISGTPVATPALIRTLHDPVQAVRLQAVKALGRTDDPAAVPALFQALQTADEQLGSQIFLALVQLRSLAVPALLTESSSTSAWIRWHCIRALGEIGTRRALPVLVHALCDHDHSVAWMAAKSLVHFGKEATVPLLRLLFTTETSPWLVETASYVLRDLYLRDPKLKPYLAPIVEDMHGVAYSIATPNAARKALSQLIADGVVEE